MRPTAAHYGERLAVRGGRLPCFVVACANGRAIFTQPAGMKRAAADGYQAVIR